MYDADRVETGNVAGLDPSVRARTLTSSSLTAAKWIEFCVKRVPYHDTVVN